MGKKLFYFGCSCIGQKGHYLHHANERPAYGSNAHVDGVNKALLERPDGIFTPANTTEGIYLESIVPPCRIVAWWDYSVDQRPGSNSVLIGIGYDNGEDMLNDAVMQYPSVMNRQARPVKINS